MTTQKKVCILLVLFCRVLASASEHVVYPAGGGNCPTPPCLTLDDYLSHASHYFTNHSSFLFLPGQHSLNTTLRLENLENVTLRATEAGATITVSPQGGVVCYNLYDFAVSGLEITFSGLMSTSAFSFENSTSFKIMSTHFLGKGNNVFPALKIVSSTGDIADSSFTNGSSLFRGGSYIGGGSICVNFSTVNFTDVNFTNNGADFGGGAVHATDSKLTFSGSISFVGNIATGRGGGAVYAERSKIILQGSILFYNSDGIGGAIFSEDSTVEVSGNINFSANYATNGGAMYLKRSVLRLQAPVNVLFDRNIAADFGGALYVEDSFRTHSYLCMNSLSKNQICFFEVGEAVSTHSPTTDIHLEFKENYADKAGSVLFGGALKHCKVRVNGVQTNFTGYQFLENISTISTKNNISSISSAPLKVCFCTSDGRPDCSFQLNRNLNTIPGRKFNLSLAAIGQADTTPARISIKENVINPQRMREDYSSQSCLSVCLSVYLLHLFWSQQRLERFNFSLNNV